MIEKIITSKTRVKILNLFLTHIDDRYYLRELERMLYESLSPLRRQLMRLVEMGILITEEEANLKYYRLNKNFEGLENLRKLVLGNRGTDPVPQGYGAGAERNAEPTRKENKELELLSGSVLPHFSGGSEGFSPQSSEGLKPLDPALKGGRSSVDAVPVPLKRIRFDVAVLAVISIFVLAVAVFVVYTNSKNLKQIASLISAPEAKFSTELNRNYIKDKDVTMPDEMASRRWKIFPGNVPVLSSGETGGGSKEL